MRPIFCGALLLSILLNTYAVQAAPSQFEVDVSVSIHAQPKQFSRLHAVEGKKVTQVQKVEPEAQSLSLVVVTQDKKDPGAVTVEFDLATIDQKGTTQIVGHPKVVTRLNQPADITEKDEATKKEIYSISLVVRKQPASAKKRK